MNQNGMKILRRYIEKYERVNSVYLVINYNIDNGL